VTYGVKISGKTIKNLLTSRFYVILMFLKYTVLKFYSRQDIMVLRTFGRDLCFHTLYLFSGGIWAYGMDLLDEVAAET